MLGTTWASIIFSFIPYMNGKGPATIITESSILLQMSSQLRGSAAADHGKVRMLCRSRTSKEWLQLMCCTLVSMLSPYFRGYKTEEGTEVEWEDRSWYSDWGYRQKEQMWLHRMMKEHMGQREYMCRIWWEKKHPWGTSPGSVRSPDELWKWLVVNRNSPKASAVTPIFRWRVIVESSLPQWYGVAEDKW